MLGWFVLFALTSLAAFAAGGLTVRAEMAGRAEKGVLFSVLFFILLGGPVLLLGYTHQLYPSFLALGSLALSLFMVRISKGDRPLAMHARDVRELALEFLRLPRDAFRWTVQARSFALLGLVFIVLTMVSSVALTYLAPSESWDGYFYHEPIVGYALQNHGFEMVPLPPDMVVQATNGYPRFCEAVALWFVIFTDKTFIEIGNTLAVPGLLLAMYTIARRYCTDSVPLIGWCAALLMMPAVVTQVRSSMLDVQVAFFLVAAIHFATRPEFRLRDAMAAIACMVLVMGAKSSALTLVPPIALVTYARVLIHHRKPKLDHAISVIVGGTAAIAGMGALTFVRNWLAFNNPIWPVTHTIKSLGIHWRGLVTLEQMIPHKPLPVLIEQKYHHPTGGIGDIIARDYGYGVPWVVVPLAAAALVTAWIVVVRGRLEKKPDRLAENFLLVAGMGIAFLQVSANVSIARYNMHIVAIAMISIAWMVRRIRKATRLHEGAMASTLIMTIVPLIWTNWNYGVNGAYVAALLRSSAQERTTMHFTDFHMPPAVARVRERDLGRGDSVVFTRDMVFPGVLWNHAMSNHLHYVDYRGPVPFLEELHRVHPKWVVVGSKSGARTTLEAMSAEWEYVGTACRQDQTMAFRRK